MHRALLWSTIRTSPSFLTKTMCQWRSAGRIGESSLRVLPCMLVSTQGESDSLARQVMIARLAPTCSNFRLGSPSAL